MSRGKRAVYVAGILIFGRLISPASGFRLRTQPPVWQTPEIEPGQTVSGAPARASERSSLVAFAGTAIPNLDRKPTDRMIESNCIN